jgi:hypothetical protein
MSRQKRNEGHHEVPFLVERDACIAAMRRLLLPHSYGGARAARHNESVLSCISVIRELGGCDDRPSLENAP